MKPVSPSRFQLYWRIFLSSPAPYPFKAELFKLEKENFKEGTKELEPLWFYGISAKRYILYNMNARKPSIRKFSLHGLGHIFNPFSLVNEEWQAQIWNDILRLHYKLITLESLSEKYSNCYAISKISISSPSIIGRFKALNKGRDAEKKIKPFNFALVGMSNGDAINGIVKPIAPFNRNPQKVVYSDFINYHDSKVMNGVQYWKKMDSVFFEYMNHKESKFDGDVGILERRHLMTC